MTPQTLAMAVLSDGKTYENRVQITKDHIEGELPLIVLDKHLRTMLVQEMRQPWYEGERLSREDLDEAVEVVKDHMFLHCIELQGKE